MARWRIIGANFFAFTLTMANMGCATRKFGDASHPKTVNIPLTPVQDQGNIATCWAYAAIGMVEAEALRQGRGSFDLSEPALIFASQLEKFLSLATKYSGSDFPTVSALEEILARENISINSFYIRVPSNFKKSLPGGDALTFISKYGAIPESAWSPTGDNKPLDGTTLAKALSRRFVKLMKGKVSGSVTADDIISKVLVGPDAYASAPPQEFDLILPGSDVAKHFTATEFTKNVLQFDEANYEAKFFGGDPNPWKLISLIKQALVLGFAPAMEFSAYPLLLSGEYGGFQARGKVKELFILRTIHSVLVTDFVNKGGKMGEMGKEQMLAEYQKDPAELDYIVSKNSQILDSLGAGLKPLLIDREYMDGQLSVGKYTLLVVPKNLPAPETSVLKPPIVNF